MTNETDMKSRGARGGRTASSNTPIVIGHRGCGKRAPENTLRALRLAIACGIEMLEIDVRSTKDEVPVLLHDATLERTTTGWGKVRDWTFDDLRKQVDSRSTQTGRVPSLAEALEITDGKAKLAIEIKDVDITEATIDAVRAARAVDRVEIWSFDDEALSVVRELAPGLPRQRLYHSAAEEGASAEELVRQSAERGERAVGITPADVTQEVVDLAHELGLRVVPGTVEDVMKAFDLARIGIDGMTSDDPLTIKQAFDEEMLAAAK